ncbi:MAG: hypothetical protein JNM62_00715 [Flavobacteriales bacterium]|nr:hypothetical protein [Flavobacteriales bacterium]
MSFGNISRLLMSLLYVCGGGMFLFTDMLKDRISQNRMPIGGVLLGYGIVRLFMWWRWYKAQEQAKA